MLNAARALMRSRNDGARPLPQVPALKPLYDQGCTPRYGEMAMVSARSGQGKSTFVLFFALAAGLKTLYLSGDMSAFQASVKLACAIRHETVEEVIEELSGPNQQAVLDQLPDYITFAFGEISSRSIERQLDAYVELHNEYPELIVVDNLMDMEGCATDYTAQSDAMQYLHGLNRETGSTLWVLAHATDKGDRGRSAPHDPPPRSEIKNGLSEKPELILTLAQNPFTQMVNVAVVKQRLGPADPSANQHVSIPMIPEQSRYLTAEEVLHGEEKPMLIIQPDDEPYEAEPEDEVPAPSPFDRLKQGAPKALW